MPAEFLFNLNFSVCLRKTNYLNRKIRNYEINDTWVIKQIMKYVKCAVDFLVAYTHEIISQVFVHVFTYGKASSLKVNPCMR